MAIIRIDKAFKVDLVNPKIVFTDHLFDFKGEGCLSFPNLFKTTKRFQEIAVETMNNKFIATDFLAVAIQHEIDHLNQILLSDK